MQPANEPQKSVASRFSIRAQLVILLVVAAAFLLGDRTREILAERDRGIQQAKQEIFEIARRGAQRDAELVSNARGVLELAVAMRELSPESPTSCQAPFRSITAALPWLSDMAIVDASGQVVCTNRKDAAPFSVSDRPYFQNVLAKRSFVLSEIITSRLTHRPVVIAATPRISGGRIEAVLVASIDVDWLSRVATAASGLETADVLLLDHERNVVATSTALSKWFGANFKAADTFWSAVTQTDGIFESDAIGGEARIVGHVRLANTGAILVVMRSRADVLREVETRARFGLGKILFTGLLCLLLVWLGGERFVLRPLGNLAKAARRLGSGDLAARVDTRALSPELASLGEAFNTMSGLLERREEQLRQANRRLAELAATDSLTGLPNRRRFDEQIEAEWLRAVRERRPVGLLLLDVDHFKKFNDRYGHPAGDECLRRIAEVLQAAARRPGDLAARTGGEEFTILLPGTSLRDAASIAEAIRADVEALSIEHLDNPHARVTVSIGIAAIRPDRSESLRRLLDSADAALYSAKRDGRNRVVNGRPEMSLAS